MKLYLAPIRGITDSIFRNTFVKYFCGFDTAICPFITTVKGDKIKKNHIKDILPENNIGLPLIPQILSNDQNLFVKMAIEFFDLGYDTINWNLGCPYPMVANKKRGSGLLPFYDEIQKFLDFTLNKIPNKLSIKCRIGRFSSDEIFNLIPVFNIYPIEELIIHPRTGIQMYTGHPDLDTFEKCIQQSKIPVIYNGDIKDIIFFNCLSNRFPLIDKWMIGRGAIENPFLPSLIKNQNIKINQMKIKDFHDELFFKYSEILYGGSHILGKMKGIWFYLSNFFKHNSKLLKKIQRVKSINKYNDIISELFSKI